MSLPAPQSNPQVITVVTQAAAPRVKRVLVDFNAKTTRTLGAIQLTSALLSVIFGGAAIVTEDNIKVGDDDDHYYYYGVTNIFMIGFGYWCPVFTIISGGLACATPKNKSQGFLRALMGMSIVGLIFATTQMGASCASTAIVANCYNCSYKNTTPKQATLAMSVFLLLLGIVQMITSIWMAKLCGDVLCCTRQETVQYVTTARNQVQVPAGQQFQIPTGQQIQFQAGQQVQIPAGQQIQFPAGQQVPTGVSYPQGAPYPGPGASYTTGPVAGVHYPQQAMAGPAQYTTATYFVQGQGSSAGGAPTQSVDQPPPYLEHAQKESGDQERL